jgi:zinc transporter 1/2/3
MASETLSLRIGAIFITFFCSLAGVWCPFAVGDNTSDAFQITKSVSAGVILGLAMMHLLPDANEDLAEAIPDYEPLAFSLACLGIIIVLAVDQVIYFIKPDMKKNVIPEAVPGDSEDQRLAPSCQGTKREHSSDSTRLEPQHNHHAIEHADGCVSKDVLQELIDADGFQRMVSAYIMEMSISIHSVIIGVDIGLLGGSSDMTTLISLVVVLSFHQFVEGIGLGSTIFASQATLGTTKVAAFVSIFALGVPVGIVIGIIMEVSNSDGGAVYRGVANSVAAGSLLYISLCQMTVPYFTNPAILDKPNVRLAMVVAFGLGVLSMAIIGIWA